MLQRYLEPRVLAAVNGLDLVAKTVVDGFVAGLHRSPDFGFSQEFAEYRGYTPGDDLRQVDWNVFARSERIVLKRYRGETNSQLTVLLDASNSMAYGSHSVNKIDYARYLAASLCYMASRQRDACGLIVFDDEVRVFIPPSTRQGQLHRLLHGIGGAEPGQRTDFQRPFEHFQEFLKRRGIAAVISDFWADPLQVVRAIAPLRFRGNEVILFHVLDPRELRPNLNAPAILIDMETQDSLEVSPEYAREEYRQKIDGHIRTLRDEAKRAGMDYFQVATDRPLDEALREYLSIRQGRF
ncbi:MAG: DUF58 domain-containing protein [Bryobacterales bacterium]|nr:DUF58 domain-containing protein [Bryobacterales bacterium]